MIGYRDLGNLNYGTAIVATISGDAITYGTATVFESASSSYISATTLDGTHVLIGYQDGGNSSYGTAVEGTISGASISFGAPVVFEAAATSYISATALDSTHKLIAYEDGGNSSFGTAVVGACRANYCYNAYAGGWETAAVNMTDCNTSSYARTDIDATVQELTAHTLESGSAGSGTITKVEVRYLGAYSNGPGSGSSNQVSVTPVFNGSTDGDVHNPGALSSSATWTDWIDITSDTNAPGTWTWADVTNLDLDITASVVGGKAQVYKVELSVTYTP